MSTDTSPPRPSGPSSARAASLDESPLRSLVSSTRRWVRLAGIGRIMAWLALAVCAAIAIDLTANLDPSQRAAAGLAILLVAAVLAIGYLWLRPRRIDTDSATRQVESAHPEFGQMLRTARDASLATPAVSPVLKSELFRRAGVQLAGLDLKKLLPRSPARKWLAAGALALIGFIVFLAKNPEAPTAFARLLSPFSGITYTGVKNSTPDPTFDRNRLPRVEALVSGRQVANVMIHVINPEGGELAYQMNPLGGGRYEVTLPASETSFDFRIEAGDSKPALGTMECVDPAVFVSSSAEVALPDYTGQAPVTQDNADINAVEGTKATLHFKMSGPMASASLKLPNGTKVPLEVNGSELSTTLEVMVGGDAAELTGTDARGHEIEPTQFAYKGVPDTLPVVEWIEPTKDIDATAVAEIPLRLRIRDDFGIASYGVVLQAQGESKDIMTKTVEARDLRDLSEMTAAALEAFPLTIRDNVRLYAWAKDHKPRADVKAVSPLRGVDIKPFKRKWQMLTGPSGPPIPMEDLAKVDQLVKTQREILSDAFPIIQAPPAPGGAVKGLGERETKLQQDASVIHEKVVEEGQWPTDDMNLLAAAVSQMGESAAAWHRIEPQPGFDRGDAALSTLLELRKNLLTLLMKADCPCLEPKPEEIPNELTDLAKEAERLAKEERDVAQQLTNAPDTDRLNAIRRQQEVANSDTGELHARMMDHPESTPLILSHMADAEKLVKDATVSTRSADAVAAAPPQLASAADELESVAKHLRALDEANMDQTLAEMAEEAKKAAEAAKPGDKGDKPEEQPKEQAGDKQGEKPGDKPADKPGAGEKPGDKPGEKPGAGEGKSEQAGKGKGEGKGEGESKSEQAGKGKGQGKGQGEGEGKSEQAGNGQGEGQSDQPGQGESKSEQAGNGKGEGKANSPDGKGGQPNGKLPGQGDGDGEGDLANNDPDAGNNTTGTGEKAGEQAGNGPGAKPGAKPGDGQPKDPETERKETLEKAARQAATNDDILKFFADRETEAGKDSRFDDLRKETGSDELEKKLNDVAEGKTDGSETAEDLKALANALEQERELRRQSRLEALAKTREEAAELKKQAEVRRDAARDAKRKAAEELAKANEGGFSFDIPKKVLEDAKKAQANNGKGGKEPSKNGKGGDKPGENGENGAGNGPGRPSPNATQNLAKDIDALKDTELSRIARELEKEAPDSSNVKPLADAERRLAEMIAEISGLARANNSEGNVPPAYRRAVEDYYRALSDDFGDEAASPP